MTYLEGNKTSKSFSAKVMSDILELFSAYLENNGDIIGEEMCHVYPLFPIDEAKPAVEKIINVIKR